MISGIILELPIKEEKIHKGAVILSSSDEICENLPKVKDYFYIIERRAWRGINESKTADIKLVEDLSTWKETRKRFPEAILLDIGPADFVDTDSFKPLDTEKEYDGIQIACWHRYKRHELFVRSTDLLPKRRFLKFGHFVNGGNLDEQLLKEKIIRLSRELKPNITYPFASLRSNRQLPSYKEEVNKYINQCRMGILTTKIEGINRFKMECLSANIPVLVPEDVVSHPTRKHINERTGLFFHPTPYGLAQAIEYILTNIDQFDPRAYVLEHTGYKRSLAKLKNSLRTLCERDGSKYHFDNISWDGRNQSLLWGDKVFKILYETIKNQKAY